MTDIPVKAHLLTVRQVAVIIQVHPNTVLNYLSQGKLKGHNPNGDKKGLRITTASVREYLASFLLEDFDEKLFETAVEKATITPLPAKRPVKTGSWVRGW